MQDLENSGILSVKYVGLCDVKLRFAVSNIPFLALLITFVQKKLFSSLNGFYLWWNLFRFQQNNFLLLHRTHSDTQWQKLNQLCITKICKRMSRLFLLHPVESDLSMLTALNQRNYVSLLFNKFLSYDSQGPQVLSLLVTAMVQCPDW